MPKQNRDVECDIVYIIDQWRIRFDASVDEPALRKVISGLLQDGFSSKYLAYIVRYCADKRITMFSPAGLIHFAYKDEVKAAYKNDMVKKYNPRSESFKIRGTMSIDDGEVASNTSLLPPKPGFQSILNKK